VLLETVFAGLVVAAGCNSVELSVVLDAVRGYVELSISNKDKEALHLFGVGLKLSISSDSLSSLVVLSLESRHLFASHLAHRNAFFILSRSSTSFSVERILTSEEFVDSLF